MSRQLPRVFEDLLWAHPAGSRATIRSLYPVFDRRFVSSGCGVPVSGSNHVISHCPQERHTAWRGPRAGNAFKRHRSKTESVLCPVCAYVWSQHNSKGRVEALSTRGHPAWARPPGARALRCRGGPDDCQRPQEVHLRNGHNTTFTKRSVWRQWSHCGLGGPQCQSSTWPTVGPTGRGRTRGLALPRRAR